MAVERLLGAAALATVNTEEALGGTAKQLGWNFRTNATGKSVVAGYVRMTSAGTFVAGTKWQLWERATPVSASIRRLNIELGGISAASGTEITVPAFTPYPIGQNADFMATIFHPSTQGGNNWFQAGFGDPASGTLSGNNIYYDTAATVDTPPQFEGFTDGAFAVDVAIDDTAVAITATLALTLPVPAVALDVDLIGAANLALILPVPQVALSADADIAATLGITLPVPAVALTADADIAATLDLTLPVPQVDLDADADIAATLDLTLPVPQVSLTGFGAQHITDVETASEQDFAEPIGAIKQVSVGTASEQDFAEAIGAQHVAGVGTASEQDFAGEIGAQHQVTVDTASEQDFAQEITPFTAHIVDVGTASEQDHAAAVPPLTAHVVDVGTASETDFGLPVPVKPVPGQPALAHLIWALARLLRDCLCAKLLETVGGPVCRCSLMAGDSAIADICEMVPGKGDGQAWVRMTRLFVTDQFPRPIADTFNCAGGLWAAEFELGVLRCGVTSDAQGQPPGADELNAEVAKVMDDAYALRITAECCIPTALPSIPGEWTPMSGGACTGGKVTVMVYLVPGPHDLIPQIPLNVMP
jgi:hypothetical protein